MERVVATALLSALTVLFLQTTVHQSAAAKPGADIRLTRKGLSYVGQMGANILRKQIVTTKLPSFAGSGHFIKYTISHINVTEIQPLQSYFPRNLSQGLTWVIRNITFDLTADFSLSFCIFHSHGTVSYSVENSTLYLPLSIGVDKAGRPTLAVTATSCRFEANSFSLTFSGPHAGFYNFLARTFKGTFHRSISKMVCSAVTTEVQKVAAKYFGKYQVNKTVGPLFTVDYGLLSAPSFNSSYMDAPLKGETFWTKKRGSTSVPVPELPPFAGRSRMVYFELTDFVFNSLGQVAFRQELLQKVLTYKDLPADQQYFFNTTCPGNLCFGKLIAQTAVKFPNSRAELHMKTSERPVVTISASSVDVSFATNIIFYMRGPNGTSTYIFAIKTKLDVQLHILRHDLQTKGRLTAAINQTSLSVGILNSDIGAINLNLLNTLMDTVISLYIRPQLNKLGAFGFPLPMWRNKTQYQNTILIQAQNALIIGADLYMKGEMLRIGGHHVAGFNNRENTGMLFQVVAGNSRLQEPIKL